MHLLAVRHYAVCLLALLSACGPTIRPLANGVSPGPVAQNTAAVPPNSTAARAAAPPGSAGDGGVVVPDSLYAGMRAAIAEAGAALGLSDSALFATAPPFAGVDSAAGEVDVEEASWDLDVLSYATHDRVARYVDLFSGPAKGRIQSWLQRGKRYEPMIREKFRARGIPEDLYYLGLVESGYDPHAYSRAAAVGMWQFMSTTARGVGLRVDWWVDERRDPVRATDAAAKFLNILNAQFGSYYLAAAAYNGGPGRVSRGLARFQEELQYAVGDERFFALAEQSYLRPETRNYVPQLIAAALIGKTPGRYGLTVSDSVEVFAYDSVHVSELVSLGSVAAATASTVEEIRDLNPHFLRGATPPRYDAWMRVPPGRAPGFDSAFQALPPEARIGFTRLRAKKGETLASVARAHGLDARRLAWFNPGVSGVKRLPVGREILVPGEGVMAGARDVPNPDLERYGPATSGRGGRVVHVVRKGESLGLIAKRYRTSVTSLKRVNGLKRTVVYPGQSIIIRGTAARSKAARPRARAAGGSAAAKGTASKAKPAQRKSP